MKVNKKFLLKKMKKMERVSLDISREEKLLETVRTFPVLYIKSHKGFKEKDAAKNAWDGVTTAFEFIQTSIYFYFDFFHLKRSYYYYLAKPISARCSQFIPSVSSNSVFHYAEAATRSQMFFKIGVLKNFTIFSRKHLTASNFIKKRLQHRCFSVNIAKFSRRAFFIEHLW